MYVLTELNSVDLLLLYCPKYFVITLLPRVYQLYNQLYTMGDGGKEICFCWLVKIKLRWKGKHDASELSFTV